MDIDQQSGAQTNVAGQDHRQPLGAGPASRWQSAARFLLCGVLVGAGLYLLLNYLRALAWAIVFAVALWPLYIRTYRRAHSRLTRETVPLLFTAVVGSIFLVPFAFLVVEAVREIQDIVDYSRQIEQSGVPVPEFVGRLPYGAQAVTEWWEGHLAHAGWLRDFVQQMNTSSLRELGRNLGASAVHRAILFGVCMMTLFFLLRDGEAVSTQCLIASQRLFGSRGERVALQMMASVHGTLNGLVLVAIGEGLLLGVVYFFAKVPHPILFGAFTAVAAMIPFAAAIAFSLAALVLLASGGVVGAIIVLAAGFVVTFAADHFVRPTLIGGATRLPFLWVLLGILGGIETFQLLGLFLGPAIMAALILLWRELTAAQEDGDATPNEMMRDLAGDC